MPNSKTKSKSKNIANSKTKTNAATLKSASKTKSAATTAKSSVAPVKHSNTLGILLEIISVIIFATSDMMVTVMMRHNDFPVGELLLFRALFGVIPLMIFVWFKSGVSGFKTRNYGLHALRCLFGTLTTLGFFISYKHMNFTDVVGISFTSTLFVTMLSVPFLGEKVGIWRWSAVIIGFMGVLVIVPPSIELLNQPWVLVMLGATAAYAGAVLMLRKMGASENPLTTVIIFQTCVGVVGGISCLFWWKTPSGWYDITMLAVIGVLGTAGQVLVTHAYRLAKAVVIAPFDYTYMIFAVIFGALVFNQPLSTGTLVGSSIIAASGLFILYRESKLHRFRALPLPD